MSNLERWNGMWEESDSPAFHRQELNPFILKFQSEIIPEDKTAAIFIPLCGKALEIKFFHDLGATIIGLEGNEKAIKLLSKEQNLDLKEQPIAGFGKVFTNTQNTIQIYCGDLFEFSPKYLISPAVQVGAVIDKGCLVALEPHMRDKYFECMQKFICDAPKCRYLSALYEHSMNKGPPHFIPLHYVCTALGRMGFRMVDYFEGENFWGLSPELEQQRRTITDVFKENAFLFERT